MKKHPNCISWTSCNIFLEVFYKSMSSRICNVSFLCLCWKLWEKAWRSLFSVELQRAYQYLLIIVRLPMLLSPSNSHSLVLSTWKSVSSFSNMIFSMLAEIFGLPCLLCKTLIKSLLYCVSLLFLPYWGQYHYDFIPWLPPFNCKYIFHV